MRNENNMSNKDLLTWFRVFRNSLSNADDKFVTFFSILKHQIGKYDSLQHSSRSHEFLFPESSHKTDGKLRNTLF